MSDHGSDYHLVLNPDVLLERDALYEALSYMEEHKETGLLTPFSRGAQGDRLYLCKRYPTVLDLFLRGFVPTWLQIGSKARLAHYEMRDLPADRESTGIPIASGCFMFLRNRFLQELNGFDPRFFLYFEDFDLSMRMGKIADIAYVPSVKITHFGGGAAHKGPRHIFWFIRSAAKFFDLHGWKLW
jgi:GT2 family glycosyltransferase